MIQHLICARGFCSATVLGCRRNCLVELTVSRLTLLGSDWDSMPSSAHAAHQLVLLHNSTQIMIVLPRCLCASSASSELKETCQSTGFQAVQLFIDARFISEGLRRFV